MEQAECSETSFKKIIQTPGNYPEESIQHSEHGESSKSRIPVTCLHNLHVCTHLTWTLKKEAGHWSEILVSTNMVT